MKKLREMKKNNKGFSLVELIVVIAIMVVLVAVLGSTILGYIDEAKYSKDIQALDSVDTVMMLLVADPNSNLDAVDGKVANLSTLFTATNGEDKPTCSNAQIIKNTLGETFTVNDEILDFNGESEAFKNITSDNVLIKMEEGKVYIYVASQASDTVTFPDYTSPSSIGKKLELTETKPEPKPEG